jgi:hypothetical protein
MGWVRFSVTEFEIWDIGQSRGAHQYRDESHLFRLLCAVNLMMGH